MDDSSIIVPSMSKKPITVLIDRWPSRKALADEIGASEAQVHKWARFGRIPSEWQFPVMQAAKSHGFDHVTAEWMLEAHHRERGAA